MQIPRLIDQSAAVEVIRSYKVLETAKEQAFDDFAVFAAHICQTPMAFITFPDGERFWFKSSVGVCLADAPRYTAFCSHTVDKADYFSINDTSTDERFSTHPFVVSEPHIRFYAGVPLFTSERIVIGTLSVADRIPRDLSSEQKDFLWILSRQIISRLELHKHVASLSNSLGKLRTTQPETPADSNLTNEKITEEPPENKKRDRLLAEMVSDTVITIDENNIILFANRAMEKIFGYTVTELNGVNLTILMPERLRHLHEAGMRRFIETGAKRLNWHSVEFIGQRKNGEEFPAEISFGEHLEDGKYHFTGVIRDVSERRLVGNLRESEERFRQLAEHIHEVFWLSEADTHEMIYISPGYAKVWGRSLESLYNAPRSWFDAVHPNDAARIGEAVILKQTRGDYDEEYRIVQPDGSIRWIRDRAFPIKNNDGEIYRVAGVAADITARKLLEMRLTAQNIVTQELAKTATLTEMMPRILQAVCENLDWKLGALWVVDNDTDEIYCVEIWQDPTFIHDEFIAVSRQARYRRGAGFPGHVWANDSTFWVTDIADDGRFPRSRIAAKEGLHGAFGFPVRLGREILGVMEFFSTDIRQPDVNLIAVMSTIGSQIGQFAARKRAEEALQQATAELESRVSIRTAELAAANRVLQAEIVMRQTAEESRVQLLHRLVGAHEEERSRIARELHDKMGQYLTVLILELHSLTEICRNHPPSHTRILRLLQVTDELMQEVHHLAWELRPAVLNDLGLNAALGSYLTQWSERNGIALDFHSCNLDKQMLSPDIETTVYRIVQESLTNILKHAQAKQVSIVIECQQNNLQVMVEDNGKGFDTEYLSYKATAEGRLGVVGMQERAAIVEGTLNIESTPDAGTIVFVRIPLPHRKNKKVTQKFTDK